MLLDSEFERIRSKDGSPAKYRSINEMADFLQMPASLLSHYRNAGRILTAKAARKIAAKFRQTPREIDELAAQLLTARRDADEDQVHAQLWIKDISAPGHLLLVEFRDQPSARPSGPNRSLARDVGCAIAAGLTYALMFPFPTTFRDDTATPVPLKNYLEMVWHEVTETFTSILRETLSALIDQNHGDPALDNELARAATRLRVYTLSKSSYTTIGACPGLGYKLFFHRNYSYDTSLPELWQWLSTTSGEKLIQKSSSELEVKAIESRFYPIINYYAEQSNTKRSLPTNKQMKDYVNADVGRINRDCIWEESQILDDAIIAKLTMKIKNRSA
jgi:hypothetical protein